MTATVAAPRSSSSAPSPTSSASSFATNFVITNDGTTVLKNLVFVSDPKLKVIRCSPVHRQPPPPWPDQRRRVCGEGGEAVLMRKE
ncbi:hypothetical protein ACLB2K_058870 [Fragaria x ananassa]